MVFNRRQILVPCTVLCALDPIRQLGIVSRA
jgi:hypothetical protein